MKQVMTNLFFKALFTMVFCLSCSTFLHSQQVELEWEGDDLWISSTEEATGIWRGCNKQVVERIDPYVFLIERSIPGTCPECDEQRTDCPSTFGFFRRVSSQVREIRLSDLPPGKYRATCLVAKAEGCLIEGMGGERSGIYLTTSSVAKKRAETRSQLVSSTIIDFRVFPNPFQNELQVQFNSKSQQTGEVRIIDALGKLVIQRKEAIYSGRNDFSLTFPDNVSDGVFWVVLVDEQGLQYTATVVKTK